jgi:hypothetical protein
VSTVHFLSSGSDCSLVVGGSAQLLFTSVMLFCVAVKIHTPDIPDFIVGLVTDFRARIFFLGGGGSSVS